MKITAPGQHIPVDIPTGVDLIWYEYLLALATWQAPLAALQTPGTGLVYSGGSLAVSLPKFTNSLGADVNLSSLGTYATGPTVAQGTTGTWFASGSVTVLDTAGAANLVARLWDGTTVIASGQVTTSGASVPGVIALSGYLVSPAGNIRIDCKDTTSTSGRIKFNQSGEAKDATLSAIRIA